MLRSADKIPSILRAGFLALLVLGVVIRPVFNHLEALHAVEHAMPGSLGDSGHGQADRGDQAPDPDQSRGAHGLTHKVDSCSSADIWITRVPPLAMSPGSVLPQTELASTRPQLLTLPFRPPIA